MIDEVGEMLPLIRYNMKTLNFLHITMKKAKIMSGVPDCPSERKAWEDLVKAVKDGKLLVSSHAQEFDLWNYYPVSEAVDLVEDICDHILGSVDYLKRGGAAGAQNRIPICSVEEDRIFLEQHFRFLIGFRDRGCVGNQQFINEWVEARSRITEQLDKVERICTADVDWEGKAVIASGGQGTVYRTSWKGTPVALKVPRGLGNLDSSHGALAGLWAEATLNAKFNHPNVVRVLAMSSFTHCGGIDPTPFLVMELATENLETWSMRQDPDDWTLKRHVLFEVAKGLHHLHQNNVVHRDIKPQNILVFSDGQGTLPVIKLCDLGVGVRQPLCWRRETTLKRQPGTLFFQAPEVFDGKRSSPESDVFSLGMVMLEVAASKRTYERNKWAGMCAKTAGKLPCEVPVGCPKDLNELIVRCLSVNAGSRPGMEEVVEVLNKR